MVVGLYLPTLAGLAEACAADCGLGREDHLTRDVPRCGSCRWDRGRLRAWGMGAPCTPAGHGRITGKSRHDLHSGPVPRLHTLGGAHSFLPLRALWVAPRLVCYYCPRHVPGLPVARPRHG